MRYRQRVAGRGGGNATLKPNSFPGSAASTTQEVRHIGLPDSRAEIVMLRSRGGGTGLELSSFIRPGHEPGSADPMPNELGLRNVTFEVDDLEAILGRLAADGYHLVGGVGQYEDSWRMASVRGPEGIIVNLAQRIN
jgi:catechol 2,3-dioxygenase-like lactoylglutathione lyase family enzyme